MARTSDGKTTNAGLRSDGELVQAMADGFEFTARRSDGTADQEHDRWIDLLSMGGGAGAADGDDDGLPYTLVWEIDGGSDWGASFDDALAAFGML